MASTTLHLHHSAERGLCLWAHYTSDDRRAAPLATLEEAVASAPHIFGSIGAWISKPMRARCTAAGTAQQVPAHPLGGTKLSELTRAIRRQIRHLGEASPNRTIASENDVDELITELAASGKPLTLAKGLHVAADFLAMLDLDSRARRIVGGRRIQPVIEHSNAMVLARWAIAPGVVAADESARESLEALVDSHARFEFSATVTAWEGSGAIPEADSLAALDPTGASVIDAFGANGAALDASPPERRQISRAFEAFSRSGLQGSLEGEADQAQLVVRVYEAEDSEQNSTERWIIEVCLREESGIMHPLPQLVAAGDISAIDALDYAGHVREHSSELADADADQSGTWWRLGTDSLSRFLSADAAQLELAGITVVLPREWTTHALKIRAQVEAATTTEDGSDANATAAGGAKQSSGVKAAMGRFRFEFSVGDQDLTAEEIQQILENQRELVKLRGQWVRLDSRTLKAAEKFLEAFSKVAWAKNPEARTWLIRKQRQASERGEDARLDDAGREPATFDISSRDFMRVLHTEGIDGLDLDISHTMGSSAKGEAAGAATGIAALFGAEASLPEFPEPRGLRAALRPYQKRGVDWLTFLDIHGLGGILADDMGLGKTMQVLALLVREREDPMGAGWGTATGGPTLLVCPMSVLGSWQREAAQWAPELRVHVHHGPDRLHGTAFTRQALASDLILTTYALVSRDFADLSTVDFHRVILDEAQHVKNSDTQVTRAVRALPGGRRLALTGTPVENDLTDLHSILSITNPGLLPDSEKAFTERFADPISDGDEAAQATLTRITQPYILRRLKTDRSIISDLPEKSETSELLNITAEQAGLYQALVDDMEAQLGELSGSASGGASELKKRSIVSGTLMKMKQVLNHPAHYLGDGSPILNARGEHRSGKLERIDDLLSTIAKNGEKALIFTQFTSFAPHMIEHWEKTHGIPVSFLHGGISKSERDLMVREFQNSPGTPAVMLLSLRAGGTGITLTAANHVIHLDRWWNPAVENQATDRAFRIGQTKNVDVRKLIAIGTIEEAIADTLESKTQLAQSTIVTGESWLADLSDAARQSMFALRLPEGH